MRSASALLLLLLLSPGQGARSRRQASCKRPASCRPQLSCVGSYTSLQELERNMCKLADGRAGVCCKDTRKRRAPPIIAVRGAEVEESTLPYDLSDNKIRDKFATIKDSGPSVKTKDEETLAHRSFTKGRKENEANRKLALKLLNLEQEFEAEGFLSLRTGEDEIDARSSNEVQKNCPWTKDRKEGGKKPECENTKYRETDGSCNNLMTNPLWGMSDTPQQRISESAHDQPGNKVGTNKLI